MDTDNRLKEIFSNYNPDLGDDEVFLCSLQKRLRVAELVNRRRAADARRTKLMLAVTFVLGVLSAVLVMLIWNTGLAAMPLVDGIGSNVLLFVNGRVVIIAVLSAILSIGIIFIVRLMYDHLSRRDDNSYLSALRETAVRFDKD